MGDYRHLKKEKKNQPSIIIAQVSETQLFPLQRSVYLPQYCLATQPPFVQTINTRAGFVYLLRGSSSSYCTPR